MLAIPTHREFNELLYYGNLQNDLKKSLWTLRF